MKENQKIKKIQIGACFRIALYLLRKRTKYAILYGLAVPGMFVVKAFITMFEAEFLKQLVSRAPEVVDNGFQFSVTITEMVIFMLIRTWYWSIDYASKMVFEFIISPVGGNLVEMVLYKILMTENHDVFSLSPVSCNYNLTEGPKPLAKIIRLVFIGFVGSAIQILSLFITIYKQSSKSQKGVSFLIIGAFILVAVIKLIHITRHLHYAYEATHLNSKKEKIYVETVNYLPIVKSYREEMKITNKYQKAHNLWEKVFVNVDLLLFTNSLFSATAFDIIITVAMIVYINDLASLDASNTSIEKITGLFNTYHSVLFSMPKLLNVGITLYQELAESVVLSQRLMEYLQFVKEDFSKKTKIESFQREIIVEDLVYFAKDKLVFSGVNFTIKKGDRIALLGRNGSGKSSIFKLLLGYNDFRGHVSIDGINIKKINVLEYRSLITYVPQDTKLYDDTIFYNLRFGNNKSYQQVIDECKKMKIHDTIMSFQNGYNTVVGQSGKKLNGGLRQKIFYTRAFLCDSDIYLFDEPTNNLDSFHSHFLYQYLDDAAYSDKTFFVITHEQSLAERFPKIFRFTDGKITEIENKDITATLY